MTIAATRTGDEGHAAYFEGRTIASFLDQQATERPDALAVVDGDVELSYAELAHLVEDAAAGMRRVGVQTGDVVLVDLPNWWEAIVTFHAVARLGAVANPVIPIYRYAELGFIVRQARPALVVVPGDYGSVDYVALIDAVLDDNLSGDRPPVAVVRPVDDLPRGFKEFGELLSRQRSRSVGESRPHDVCLLLYTSGTTAEPKGVLHSHDTLVYECRSIEELFGLGREDHVFMASPLTHITGFLYGFLLPVLGGRAVALLDVWDPSRAVDVVERHRCRFTVGATPFLRGLVEEHARRGTPSHLGHFASGGADVPPSLVERATSVLDADVCRVYGSSEFPTASCSRPTDSLAQKAQTDGYPIGPVDVRLDDVVDGVGELLIRGPEMFLGYLNASLNGDSFTADGYFRTGDLASIDADGFITIRGRKKDIIIRNGENISAREVEDLLYDHPGLLDVAVVAIPDEITGERACAFVVPAPGADVTLDDIVSHLERAGIAKQKLPEQLEVVSELPRTASGKVQKFLLRRRLDSGTG